MDAIPPLVAPIDDRSLLPSRLYRPWSAARWYREGRISEKVLVELLAELPEAAIPGPPCTPEWREAMSAAVREGYCHEALFQCFTSHLVSAEICTAADARHRELFGAR